jgi:hypothetical protein
MWPLLEVTTWAGLTVSERLFTWYIKKTINKKQKEPRISHVVWIYTASWGDLKNVYN